MKLSDYIARIPETNLSSLLGISKQEFDMLIHSPLYHYKNSEGIITEFFIHISPRNSKKLLRKIKGLSNNFKVFDPNEIFAMQQQIISNRQKQL